jgi:hypothetical protein
MKKNRSSVGEAGDGPRHSAYDEAGGNNSNFNSNSNFNGPTGQGGRTFVSNTAKVSLAAGPPTR